MVTRQQLIGLLRVAWQRQTYLNILYLLLAFPLGLMYFVLLITGLATGIGTAILGVGVLLLILVFGFAWAMADLERRLVMAMLRVTIAPLAGPRLAYDSRRAQIWAHLRRPITWKSLAYLLAEFPFGVISFTLTVTLLSLSIASLLYPLGLPFSSRDATTPYGDIQFFWQHLPAPLALVLTGAQCLLASAVGLCLTAGSLHALNGMAYGWGQFARLMLGMSPGEQQLAEARASARREQARAERSDQRRRELIVNVSHELRTPIANIRGHIESLRMPLGTQLSDAERQHYLGIVARETERLGALVDDLLALARADADELHLDVRPVAVERVVAEVHQALAPLAQRDRQVSVVRNVAPGLPYALADRDRLAQVLLNLARNAITATPAGGLVFLDLEQADAGHIALNVSDTGRGIPQEDLDRIFDRFYRTDAARTRATGGFGLGLSIVRDLVTAMGGTITVTSTPDVGSCFQVLLRIAPTASP